MKLLPLLAITLLIVGVAFAAEPKINPGTQINWNKNISAHMHGLINGSGQDAATYSQLVAANSSMKSYVDIANSSMKDYVDALPTGASKVNISGDTMDGVLNVVNGTGQAAASYAQLQQPGSNISYGGYVQSGRIAPTRKAEVFLYTLPWVGLQMAVAMRTDGWPISISATNSTAIQAAITSIHNSGGGQVVLASRFTGIATTINSYTDVQLVGYGISTGLEGTANPVLKITGSKSWIRSEILSNMAITATANNDAVKLDHPLCGDLSKLNLTVAGNGSCLDIHAWSVSTISGCGFMTQSNNRSGNGLRIRGDATHGAVGVNIVQSSFYYLDKAIWIDTTTAAWTQGLFLSGITACGNNYHIWIGQVMDFTCTNSNLDGAVIEAIHIEGGSYFRFSQCWIDADSGSAINATKINSFISVLSINQCAIHADKTALMSAISAAEVSHLMVENSLIVGYNGINVTKGYCSYMSVIGNNMATCHYGIRVPATNGLAFSVINSNMMWGVAIPIYNTAGIVASRASGNLNLTDATW